jgi:hypothetical protein
MVSRYRAQRSHSLDTTKSVGLLWMSDKPDSETSPWKHTTLTTKKKTSILPVGFEPKIPERELPDPRLRLCGRWDRLTTNWQKKDNQEPPGNLRNWTGTIFLLLCLNFPLFLLHYLPIILSVLSSFHLSVFCTCASWSIVYAGLTTHTHTTKKSDLSVTLAVVKDALQSWKTPQTWTFLLYRDEYQYEYVTHQQTSHNC